MKVEQLVEQRIEKSLDLVENIDKNEIKVLNTNERSEGMGVTSSPDLVTAPYFTPNKPSALFGAKLSNTNRRSESIGETTTPDLVKESYFTPKTHALQTVCVGDCINS